MNYGEAALPVAMRELGVKESPAGSNTGPRVRAYLMGHPPEPWCADFGTWCLMQIGFPLPKWNWSYCPSWEEAARGGQAGMCVTDTPMPGDVVLYDWDGGVADHFGRVVSVQSPDAFTAVEGNTSVGNDSNGGQVMLRTRTRSQVQCFIRLPQMPKLTLAQRLRAAGYGARTVALILRNLKAGVSGGMPNPSDREMFDKLVADGMSPASARAAIKSIRKENTP